MLNVKCFKVRKYKKKNKNKMKYKKKMMFHIAGYAAALFGGTEICVTNLWNELCQTPSMILTLPGNYTASFGSSLMLYEANLENRIPSMTYGNVITRKCCLVSCMIVKVLSLWYQASCGGPHALLCHQFVIAWKLRLLCFQRAHLHPCVTMWVL